MAYRLCSLILISWLFLGIAPNNSEFGFNFYTQKQCKDFLGSALYLHPKQCHLHPSPFNCRILGPSIAVQQGWSFSNDCIQSKPFKFLPH